MMKTEYADVNMRERFGGVPHGLQRARLICAGADECFSCQKPSTRSIGGIITCDDPLCQEIAQQKRRAAKTAR